MSKMLDYIAIYGKPNDREKLSDKIASVLSLKFHSTNGKRDVYVTPKVPTASGSTEAREFIGKSFICGTPGRYIPVYTGRGK